MDDFLKLRGDGPILLVNDDDADAWLLRRCYEMSALDNELIRLGSALELMEYLREIVAGSARMPALIMLELRMPGFDPLHMLRLIDSIPDQPPAQVLVFTHSQDPYQRQQSNRLGVTAWRALAADPAETIEYFNSLAA